MAVLMRIVGYDIDFTEGATGSLKNNYGSKRPSKGVQKNNIGNTSGKGLASNRLAGSDKPSKGVKKIDEYIKYKEVKNNGIYYQREWEK